MKQELSRSEYVCLLEEVIRKVRQARLKIIREIGQGTTELYRSIGQELSERKIEEGYGAQVVKQLSSDLVREFPGTTSYSPRNLWYMKKFYERYCQADEKVKQCVSLLPWGHNILLMQQVDDLDAVYFYATKSTEYGWTRKVLLNQIKAHAYEVSKSLPKQHNFCVLPDHLHEQADEMIKSRYNLDFLGIARPYREKELENRLIEKIKYFILELGKGFCYIGNQYRLTLEEKEYFVDMLFYFRPMRCLVAIELKIGEFEPEYIGKLNFYLELLDRQVKLPDENPSIGLLLCARRNYAEVELALQTSRGPIGVSEYQLLPEKELKQFIRDELYKSETRDD